MKPREEGAARLTMVVAGVEEFDELTSDALPYLLAHAGTHTRRYLRETGQWADDISHEKLALRWAYEMVERFLVCGRSQLPCRPLFALDSLIAGHLSQAEPFCYHKDLVGTTLGRYVEGLVAKSVVSRDALITLFHHFYGWGPGQVAKLLGFGADEAQRVYKNYERWKKAGWLRTVTEIGLTDIELKQLESSRSMPDFNEETERLLRIVQGHYRKSEPDHYVCRNGSSWRELFSKDFANDYRIWHLAMCIDCLADVHAFRVLEASSDPFHLDVHIYPRTNGQKLLHFPFRGGGHAGRRSAERLSRASR